MIELSFLVHGLDFSFADLRDAVEKPILIQKKHIVSFGGPHSSSYIPFRYYILTLSTGDNYILSHTVGSDLFSELSTWCGN